MPYIKQEQRTLGLAPTNPGELNYAITKLISEYCDRNQLSYQRINDVLGSLEGAKLEFYRRVARPYEDRKIAENGDIAYYREMSEWA